MNIVNKLTVRHLKLNKKRTLVTIAGVIISVAMITAVMLLGVSFIDLFKRESIATNGNWHMKFEGLPASRLDVVKNSPYGDELMLERNAGYALLAEQGLTSASITKNYIHIREYNEAAFSMFPLRLVEGRLPSQPNEVVVPQHYLKHFNKGTDMIGTTLTVSLGHRQYVNEEGELEIIWQNTGLVQEGDELIEQFIPLEDGQTTYTVVGVIERLNWEYAVSPGYSFLSYLDENQLSDDAVVTASLYSTQPDKGIFQESESIARTLELDRYGTNNDLLRYQFVSSHDGFVVTLYLLMAIILGVIMIGSISLIYNAFGISVADRSRYLGMLASVGATKRQKRNSVLFEGLIISAVSIPIGILSAYLGLAITFAVINSSLVDVLNVSVKLEIKWDILAILVSIAISLLTIFLSTWWPAKRASRVSAIDAIRLSQDVKLSRKRVKTSKLIRKLFGLEAEIALKNIKRNKRRYQITVFSLVISIILFLTVSYLTMTLKTAVFSSGSGINYELSINHYGSDEPDFDMINSFEGVKEYNHLRVKYVNGAIATNLIPERILDARFDHIEKHSVPEHISYSIFFYEMDDEKLKIVAEQAGLPAGGLFDPEQPQAIIYNVSRFYDKNKKRYIFDAALTKTDHVELPLRSLIFEEKSDEAGNVTYEENFVDIGNIHIVGATESAPIGVVGGTSAPEGIALLVSESAMTKLRQLDEMRDYRNALYITSDDPNKLEEDLLESQVFSEHHIGNQHRNKQEEEVVMFIISVFSYGFITLITLISIANILNTISTSIALRKREFAMLRSIGMTKQGFYRMINYESLLYGLKALVYGLPLSLGVMWLIYTSMQNTAEYAFQVPWGSVLVMMIALFAIVGLSMLYSGSKVKKGSIVDAIKQENL